MATQAYLAFEPADEAAARHVAGELERNGWTVLRSGPEYRAQENLTGLVQAIGEAAIFIVVTSQAAHESTWMQREVAAALNNGRPFLIIRAGDAPADSWLNGTLDLASAIDLSEGPKVEALAKIAETARNVNTRGRVISMLNIKGGVGKTILAANLFAAAHLADKRAITFIDLDPQHNLSQYFLSASERNKLRDEGRTIYSVISNGGSRVPLADIATPLNRSKRSKLPRFDLIAGDERLFEYTLDTRSDRDKAAAFTRFRQLVATLRARSHAVVIDSNPCATFLTRLAITSADHIVAPVRPEKYSLTGLNMLEHVVREVRGRPLRPAEFSVLLNGVNDRPRPNDSDADALTRAEISSAAFFSTSLLPEEIPYSGALKAPPSDRIVANPINTTAIMRVGSRQVKESLARAAAAVLRRSFGS